MMSMSRSLDFFPLPPDVFSFFATVWFEGILRFAFSVFGAGLEFREGVELALLGAPCAGRGYSVSARLVRVGFSVAGACAPCWSGVLAFPGSSWIVAACAVDGVAGKACFLAFSSRKSGEAPVFAGTPLDGSDAFWADFASLGVALVVD